MFWAIFGPIVRYQFKKVTETIDEDVKEKKKSYGLVELFFLSHLPIFFFRFVGDSLTSRPNKILHSEKNVRMKNPEASNFSSKKGKNFGHLTDSASDR